MKPNNFPVNQLQFMNFDQNTWKGLMPSCRVPPGVTSFLYFKSTNVLSAPVEKQQGESLPWSEPHLNMHTSNTRENRRFSFFTQICVIFRFLQVVTKNIKGEGFQIFIKLCAKITLIFPQVSLPLCKLQESKFQLKMRKNVKIRAVLNGINYLEPLAGSVCAQARQPAVKDAVIQVSSLQWVSSNSIVL